MKILGLEPAMRPASTSAARLERSRMEREISTVFDRLFAPTHPFRPVADRGWNPFTDIYESATHVVVRMELAGIDTESLRVTKDGRCLIIRGTRPEPPWGDNVACHQLEISYGTFERVLCLPVDFREESVHAEYGRTGFLHITIAKD